MLSEPSEDSHCGSISSPGARLDLEASSGLAGPDEPGTGLRVDKALQAAIGVLPVGENGVRMLALLRAARSAGDLYMAVMYSVQEGPTVRALELERHQIGVSPVGAPARVLSLSLLLLLTS